MALKFYAKITSRDLTGALTNITAWDGKTRLAVENVLLDGTKNIAIKAKERVAERSGRLKKSIKTGFNRRKLEGVVRARTPYAHIVEFGSKSYVVKAKNKKALKIPGGSGLVFRKSARIPVRKGKPFITPAFKSEESKIVSDVKKVINK